MHNSIKHGLPLPEIGRNDLDNKTYSKRYLFTFRKYLTSGDSFQEHCRYAGYA